MSAFFAIAIVIPKGRKYDEESMTPVILLSDGYLGNGSQLFRIPKMADLPKINPPFAKPNDPDYAPYNRDSETLVRQWAVPGMEGLRHRIGGLEKLSGKGSVSTDNANHQLMVNYRKEKVERVANRIPNQSSWLMKMLPKLCKVLLSFVLIL